MLKKSSEYEKNNKVLQDRMKYCRTSIFLNLTVPKHLAPDETPQYLSKTTSAKAFTSVINCTCKSNFCLTVLTTQRCTLGLRKLLATESPLKMMKNAFYFNLKALFILKIFKFLS